MAYQVSIDNDRGPLRIERVESEKEIQLALIRVLSTVGEVIATDKIVVKEIE